MPAFHAAAYMLDGVRAGGYNPFACFGPTLMHGCKSRLSATSRPAMLHLQAKEIALSAVPLQT